MLTIPASARLFLCKAPVNMRKSFEGLGKIVDEMFPGELMSGSFFIFLNRRREHIKVLYWDGDGFAIWYKRLEKGTFGGKTVDPSFFVRRDFLMMLEGVIPKRLALRFSP